MLRQISFIILFSCAVFAQDGAINLLLMGDAPDSLGAELQVNGTFDANIDGWSQYPSLEFSTFEWSSGRLHLVGDGTRSLMGGTAFSVEAGKTYRITISVDVVSGVIDALTLNLTAYLTLRKILTAALSTDAELYILYECANTEDLHITADCTNAVEFYLDNISVKEVLNP